MDAPHTDGAYALVKDGQIVDVFTFGPNPHFDPSETWLPINKTEDSEPFTDPRTQSRDFPTYRIDGNRVIRTFQVRRAG